MTNTAQDLPPLPEPTIRDMEPYCKPTGFTVEQMRAYVLADRARRSPVAAEPVLWYRSLIGAEAKQDGRCYDTVFAPMPGYTPLYAHPSDAQAAADAAREELAKHFAAMPGREMFGGTIADEIREEFIGQPVAAQSKEA